MKRAPTPAETLKMCLDFSENELIIAAKNPSIDEPGAHMQSMDQAQHMRSKPHMTFGS